MNIRRGVESFCALAADKAFTNTKVGDSKLCMWSGA